MHVVLVLMWFLLGVLPCSQHKVGRGGVGGMWRVLLTTSVHQRGGGWLCWCVLQTTGVHQ